MLILLAQTRPFDQTKGEVDGGVATLKGLEAIFDNVISIALLFAGTVLFLMFLVGGFRFITSGGDPKALEAAKGTLTHAVIGLVVLILAFVILKLVADFTAVQSILQFQIRR